MRREVAADLGRSTRDFVDVVWPVMGDALGGGELIPVETTDSAASKLDQIAGIDAWIVQQDTHMFGLGSRVQWQAVDDDPWKTFTVRLRRPNGTPTEYEKRQKQIAIQGSLYPKWTCQGYVEKGQRELLKAAIAPTIAVIAAVTAGLGYEQTAYDGVKFWVVPWSELWEAGCSGFCVYDGDRLYVKDGAA